MRTAFIDTLTELMRSNKNIFTITADMGFSVFEAIQQEFPDRFLNTGVTEQSSIGIAAGIALSGYKVFFYAQAPFATMRCFEQVRLDVAYGDLDVKIVGSACGFSSNQLGISHYALEDIALMRTLPMFVFCPGDPWEAAVLTKAAAEIKGPVYVRLGKRGDPVIHQKEFKVGEGIELREGSALTLIATGTMVSTAVEVASQLKNVRVLSMPTVKPLDRELVLLAARETGAIFTLEEHLVIGGLGSAVAEILTESDTKPKVFYRFGVREVDTRHGGSLAYLRDIHGLSVSHIIKKIQELLS